MMHDCLIQLRMMSVMWFRKYNHVSFNVYVITCCDWTSQIWLGYLLHLPAAEVPPNSCSTVYPTGTVVLMVLCICIVISNIFWNIYKCHYHNTLCHVFATTIITLYFLLSVPLHPSSCKCLYASATYFTTLYLCYVRVFTMQHQPS